MLERPNDLRSCSLADAFMTIGGIWKPYIVWYLNTAPNNTMRYGELRRHIPWTISHKIYAQQLHELEDDGIITRHEYMEGNIRVVDYTLTEAGRFLVPAILYLRDWRAVFGGFPASALTRTQGSWEDETISYHCEATDDSGIAATVTFDVARTREESLADSEGDAFSDHGTPEL